MKDLSLNPPSSDPVSSIAPTATDDDVPMDYSTSKSLDSIKSQPNHSSHIGNGISAQSSANDLGTNAQSPSVLPFEVSEPQTTVAPLAEDPAVQQPTSNLREHFDTTTVEQSLGIMSQEQSQGLPGKSSLANGIEHRRTIPPGEDSRSTLTADEDVMDMSTPVDERPDSTKIDLPHHPAVPLSEATVSTSSLDPTAQPTTEQEIQPRTDHHAPQATATQKLQPSSQDHIMQDVAVSSGKGSPKSGG